MGAWDDILKGTKGDDIIYGGAGDDYLQGKAGDDILDGGDGNDQLHGDADDDILIGGRGDDLLHGGTGGYDTAVYFGSVFEYSHYWEGDNFVISHLGGAGADGKDRLLHIERLIFADAVIDLTQNNAPIAFDDTASTNEDVGTYSSGSASVLDNDFDWEGQALTVAAGSFTGTYGTLVMNANGTYTYTPFASTQALAQGQVVVDSFSYTVSDGSLTDTGTLSITVSGLNDAPVANPDTASGHENQVLTIDVLANDTDVDNGAVLTVVAASAPKGTAAVVGNQVEFDPGTDFDHLADGASEDVVISYTIQDEHGATSSSTVTVTVTGTNDGPVANADTASGHENQVLTVDVLANDTDVDDGAVLTVVAASAPKGTASVVGNQVEFDPGTDFDHLADGASEIVLVGYTIEDEHGASSSSTVAITVTGTNDGPVANADTATTGENVSALIDVLANDTDVDDGAVLTVVSASAPSGQGSASVVGNQVEFDPGTDFDYLAVGESVDVVISYTIEDEHGASSSSTATVTVTGTNDAPTIDAGGTTATGAVTELPNGDPNENSATHSANGTVAFDDLDLSDTHSATATPQGGSYLGTFTLDPVDQNGDSVGWNFSVSDADLDSLEEGEVVTQTYTIEIDDGNGGTTTQDVTITITGAADSVPPDGTNWYIDNSAVGSANTGSPTDPFTSIAAFNAVQGTPGGPGVGDNVFLLTGTGTGVYAEADGINLLDGQVLTGVATGAVRPLIVTTGAGNHGVELAQNNSVSGLDIGTTTGAGIADGGGSVGNLTVSNVGISGGGQIVDIDQGGTINVTLNGAASTGSTGGAIDLNAVGGSFTVTGATSITGSHTGGGVDVTASSLAVTFAGGGNVAVTGTARGVNFVGNTGSLTISGGNFDISSGTGRALNVENGGTVTIGGAGNNIATTGGPAVMITNATSAGVTLESVSSVGGTLAGVVLNNAGSGGFTVTGIGSVAGSGGAITGKTGTDAQAATNGTAIVITNTDNVSLANMTISGNANYGILGSNVANFTLRDSTVGPNGSNNLTEASISFTNLTGTALIEGNNVSGGASDNIRVVNSTGSLALTIQDSASDQAVMGANGLNGNDNVYIETGGSASLTLVVDGVSFLGARGDQLQVHATGSSSQDITISDSSFANGHANTVGGGGGLTLGGGGSGSNIIVDYRIEDSSFTGADGSAISAVYTPVAGTIRGFISGNTVGVNDGVGGSEGSSGGGSGILAGLEKLPGAGNASYTVTIDGNAVYDIAFGLGGIELRSSGGGAANPATFEATVTDNVVDELGDFTIAALYAIVGGSATSGDFGRMGLELTGNTFDAGDADFGLNAVYLDQISSDAHYYIPGYGGSGNGEFVVPAGTASADLDAFWSADNVFVNGGFPNFPGGGVDASFISDATGDPLTLPVWFG